MPGARMAKKMPPNLASGLKRTKASEELERVRGWVALRAVLRAAAAVSFCQVPGQCV